MARIHLGKDVQLSEIKNTLLFILFQLCWSKLFSNLKSQNPKNANSLTVFFFAAPVDLVDPKHIGPHSFQMDPAMAC